MIFTRKMSNSAALAKQYKKKTDKEHVLDNPDTYIGSKEYVDENPQQAAPPTPVPSEAPEDMGLGRKDMENKRLQYLRKMMGK